MEMKRMFLALPTALAAIEMPKCEESVKGHTSDSVLQGSELSNKKPYGYTEPRRLSITKWKIKKQRAKMAKASKRANRNK